MKIVVEGGDNVGKTHYIEQFIKNHPDRKFKVIHCTRQTPNTYEWFKSLFKSDEDIIFDRGCFGQFAYQTAEERRSRGQLNGRQLHDLEEIMIEEGVTVIYIYADPEVVLYNCKKDSQDSYYTIEYIKNLDSKFRAVLESSIMNVNYVYNDYHPEEMDKEDNSNHAKNFDYSSLPYIVCVDFDGTIAYDAFPDIKNAVPSISLINKLKEFKEVGCKLVLWTCRTDDALIEACNYCADMGLFFDAVNENVKEVLDAGLDPRKIYADFYIDDKGITPGEFIQFEKLN